MEHTGRVLANGVFDILHPGHIYYLEQAAALGDELYVVVTPDSMTEKETVFDEEERVRVVDALGCVDNAFLGSEDEKTHVYDTVNRVNPGIIVLGYDQDFDVDQLRKDLAEHGFTVDVTRIDQYLGETTSSTEIRRRIRQSGT